MLNEELFDYVVLLATKRKTDLISFTKSSWGSHLLFIEFSQNYIKLVLNSDVKSKSTSIHGGRILDIRQSVSHIIIHRPHTNDLRFSYAKWYYKTPNQNIIYEPSYYNKLVGKTLLSLKTILERKIAEDSQIEVLFEDEAKLP